jgi:transposase
LEFASRQMGGGLAAAITAAISRCGDEMMRVMLYEAAQSMLMRSTRSWLKAWAMQIVKRRRMKLRLCVHELQG